ncbi:hypothetical protein KZ813_09655 [Sphingomonas sp. RHCKR7]|uniref:hypothetical protein n=1 Tax=Sphingomonas folli TaxID=2862497 RepID=UPI001CA4F395|nr:hypothetical protein [Sphingomonas folli]MBW6527102.1 hypothetical protein [Sphingomonas folli]
MLDDLDRFFHFTAPHEDQAARRVAERLIARGASLRAFPRPRPGADGRREMTTVPPSILRDEMNGPRVFVRPTRHRARLPDQTA